MNDPRIPVNIVTGFLGVGKTTTILSLLANRPGREPWAVLVNEFGKVPIDQAAMRALGEGGTQIAEVAGGCLCCTAGVNMHQAMARLIQEASPARVLIEPTGLGHPDRIREILTGPSFAASVRPAPTLCLVDPRQYTNPRFEHILAYWEQVKCADVLVVNKTDLVDAATLDACRSKMAREIAARVAKVEASQGRVAPAWLDVDPAAPGTGERAPEQPAAHGHRPAHERVEESLDGRVRRLESAGLGRHACGWVLDPDIVLSHQAVGRWLRDPAGARDPSTSAENRRVKGVLHTDRGWWVFNAVGSEATWHEIAPSTDSRIECISGEGTLDWSTVEERLLACIRA